MARLPTNSKKYAKSTEELTEKAEIGFALDPRFIEGLRKKPSLKVMPGDYNEDIQEANIELEGVGVVATFLKIGYFIKNDELCIRNHITGNSILIPKDFHFLKVVKDGINNYKLAFCNSLGNLFFDYKKYDKEYINLPEEYKLIDLKYVKNAINIDLSRTPLFIIKKGEFEGESLENYKTDIYEIGENKKVGTLIDEFGYFKHGLFHYVDYHHGYNHCSKNPEIKIKNYEGNVQIENNTVHPISLGDNHLNFLDYLGYH